MCLENENSDFLSGLCLNTKIGFGKYEKGKGFPIFVGNLNGTLQKSTGNKNAL